MVGKLASLILYIADKCQTDASFGATKLNKILFTVDFMAYGAWGESVSGATYMRLGNGPVPRELLAVRGQLIEEGRVCIQEREYYGRIQKRLVPLAEPDMSGFTEQEMRLVDQVTADFGRYNATQLSNWTHTLRPWLAAGDREEIPYYTVFTFMDAPASAEAISWSLEKLTALQAAGALQC